MENIVKGCPGIKATDSSGLSFGRYKEVPQIVYTCTKRERTHARKNACTHTQTHTHDYTISDHPIAQRSNSKATETSGLCFGQYKEVPHIDSHAYNIARTQT